MTLLPLDIDASLLPSDENCGTPEIKSNQRSVSNIEYVHVFVSNILIQDIAPIASLVLSGENCTASTLEAAIMYNRAPVLGFQIMTFSSSDVDANLLPSGENCTAFTL
jgi:hypothetical protein